MGKFTFSIGVNILAVVVSESVTMLNQFQIIMLIFLYLLCDPRWRVWQPELYPLKSHCPFYLWMYRMYYGTVHYFYSLGITFFRMSVPTMLSLFWRMALNGLTRWWSSFVSLPLFLAWKAVSRIGGFSGSSFSVSPLYLRHEMHGWPVFAWGLANCIIFKVMSNDSVCIGSLVFRLAEATNLFSKPNS